MADPQLDAITMRIAELEASLLAANPMMPTFLRVIHAELLKSPELVHVLTNEQRAVIVAGLQKQTGVEVLAATAAKRKTPKVQANLTELL